MLAQTSGGQIIVLLPLFFYILRVYPEQIVQYLA